MFFYLYYSFLFKFFVSKKDKKDMKFEEFFSMRFKQFTLNIEQQQVKRMGILERFDTVIDFYAKTPLDRKNVAIARIINELENLIEVVPKDNGFSKRIRNKIKYYTDKRKELNID